MIPAAGPKFGARIEYSGKEIPPGEKAELDAALKKHKRAIENLGYGLTGLSPDQVTLSIANDSHSPDSGPYIGVAVDGKLVNGANCAANGKGPSMGETWDSLLTNLLPRFEERLSGYGSGLQAAKKAIEGLMSQDRW